MRTACTLYTLRAVHARSYPLTARLVDAGEGHVLVRGGGDTEDVGRQLPVAGPVVLEHALAAVDG